MHQEFAEVISAKAREVAERGYREVAREAYGRGVHSMCVPLPGGQFVALMTPRDLASEGYEGSGYEDFSSFPHAKELYYQRAMQVWADPWADKGMYPEVVSMEDVDGIAVWIVRRYAACLCDSEGVLYSEEGQFEASMSTIRRAIGWFVDNVAHHIGVETYGIGDYGRTFAGSDVHAGNVMLDLENMRWVLTDPLA